MNETDKAKHVSWLKETKQRFTDYIKKLEHTFHETVTEPLKSWLSRRIEKQKRYLTSVEIELTEHNPIEQMIMNWISKMKKYMLLNVPSQYESKFSATLVQSLNKAAKYPKRYRRSIFNETKKTCFLKLKDGTLVGVFDDFGFLDVYTTAEREGWDIELLSLTDYLLLPLEKKQLAPKTRVALKVDLRLDLLMKRFAEFPQEFKALAIDGVKRYYSLATSSFTNLFEMFSDNNRSKLAKWYYDLLSLFVETNDSGFLIVMTENPFTLKVDTSLDLLNPILEQFIEFASKLGNKAVILDPQSHPDIKAITSKMATVYIDAFIFTNLQTHLKERTRSATHDFGDHLMHAYQDEYQFKDKQFMENAGFLFNMNRDLLFSDELTAFSNLVDVVMNNGLKFVGETIQTLQIK